MFFQSCFLSDFIIIDRLFLFRGLFFYSLFRRCCFLFLLFLTFLGWVDLGGFMVFVF
ncbi:hypothetical protein HPHPA5_0003 [Helicobacter pylori Hp A-5]|nr:hypothetical protein HPHPA5_1669 [Helicobacter pylori Hp A-5]EJB44082.1 hypothetical protein HPHPA5_0003 [Helicobacter pylori Hp A-5]